MIGISPLYLAGLFDGEGTLCIKRVSANCSNVRTKWDYRFQGYAHITLKNEDVVEAIKREIGGGSVKKVKSRSPKHANYFCLIMTGKALSSFLDYCGKYLIIKHQQAVCLSELVMIKRRIMNKPTSEGDYIRQCELFDTTKSLNEKCHNDEVYAKAMLELIEPIVPVAVKAFRENQ